jgi:c-di-GMP-binding flagellar brake protein YcgR
LPSRNPLLPETDSATLARFEIRDALSVARVIEDLVRDRAPITLYEPRDFGEFALSRIVHRDAQWLGLEFTTDERRQGALLRADTLVVVAMLDSIKVQFDAGALRLERSGERATLRCALPERVYRIQRRDAFRVRPLPMSGADCVVRTPDGVRAYPLLDVSVGGVALLLAEGEPVPPLGHTWLHCHLDIAGYPAVPCDLEVRFIGAGPPEGCAGVRVGCVFVRPAPETERAVQVYVMDVERGRSPAQACAPRAD